MPTDIEDLTFREARQKGRLEEWHQSRGKGKTNRQTESHPFLAQSAQPGDILAARDSPTPEELGSIRVRVEGRVPASYELRVEIRRGEALSKQLFSLKSGGNDLVLSELPRDLPRDAMTTVQLVSDREVSEIGPILTTLIVSHA